MAKNIINGKSLNDYKRKYTRLRGNLSWFTKKEVKDFDKKFNSSENLLLENRKWYLVDDVYYEIPKAPRLTWYLNLNKAIRISLYVILAGGIAAGSVIPNLPKPSVIEEGMRTNIDKLNAMLKEEKSTLHTCYDALLLAKNKLDIDVEHAKVEEVGQEYVYDLKENKFIIMNGDELVYPTKDHSLSNKNYLWKLVSTVDSATEYSQYLRSDSNESITDVSIISGFDVGVHKEIKSVHYKNDSNTRKDVVFRTFDYSSTNDEAITNLTIRANTSDGDGDHVEHYGDAANLYIVTCSKNSYHEYGEITWAEVYEGALSLDKNLDVIGRENKGVIKNVEVKAETTGRVELKEDGGNVQSVISTNDQIVQEIKTQLPSKPQIVETKTEEQIKTKKIDEFKDKEAPTGNLIVIDNQGVTNTYYSSFIEFATAVKKDSTSFFDDKTVKLTTDYDLSSEVDVDWVGVGSKDKAFPGIFDGQNHKITNYSIEGELTADYNAIFGGCSGTLQNIVLENCHINNTGTAHRRNPILLGYGTGNITVKNIQVKNCSVQSVEESNGLLCSHIESGSNHTITFENIEFDDKCYIKSGANENTCTGMLISTARRKVSGQSLDKIIIKNCTTRGTVDGCGAVGAFIGQLGGEFNSIEISNCNNYASIIVHPNITGTPCMYGGGFVGYIHNKSGVKADVKFKDCNNYGSVSGEEEHGLHMVAGFVGYSTDNDIYFTNCVNEGAIGSETATAAGGFIGRESDTKTSAGETFVNCVNKGNITANLPNLKSSYGHFIAIEINKGQFSCDDQCKIEGQLIGEANRTILVGEPA